MFREFSICVGTAKEIVSIHVCQHGRLIQNALSMVVLLRNVTCSFCDFAWKCLLKMYISPNAIDALGCNELPKWGDHKGEHKGEGEAQKPHCFQQSSKIGQKTSSALMFDVFIFQELCVMKCNLSKWKLYTLRTQKTLQ